MWSEFCQQNCFHGMNFGCMDYCGQFQPNCCNQQQRFYMPNRCGRCCHSQHMCMQPRHGNTFNNFCSNNKRARKTKKDFSLNPMVNINRTISALVLCGTKIMNALIDTGASTSCIKASAATNIELAEITKSKQEIQFANGSKSEVNGIMVTMITFGNQTIPLKLLIVADLSDDLILGINFLGALNGELKCGDHFIRIPKSKEDEEIEEEMEGMEEEGKDKGGKDGEGKDNEGKNNGGKDDGKKGDEGKDDGGKDKNGKKDEGKNDKDKKEPAKDAEGKIIPQRVSLESVPDKIRKQIEIILANKNPRKRISFRRFYNNKKYCMRISKSGSVIIVIK